MITRHSIALPLAVLLVLFTAVVRAADTAAKQIDQPAPVATPMPENAPMDTGMMKKGMTLDDVRKAAMARKKKMDEMMEEERKKAGM